MTALADESTLIMCKSREEWLEQRRQSIGSSDMAAILGVSRFANPFDVYLSKVEGKDSEESMAMRLGSALEPSIRRLVSEEAEVECLEPLPHALYRAGVFHDTPDGFVVGSLAPMEVKYQASGRHDYERDGIPLDYRVQCFQHMEILGAERCLFGVVSRDQLYVEWVERNESFMTTAMEYAADWWERHIVKQAPPDLHEAPLRILKDFFPEEVKGKRIDLTQDTLHKVEALRIARAQAAEAKQVADGLEAWIRADLGDAEVGLLPDGREVSLKTQKRKGYTVEPVTFRSLRLPKKGQAESSPLDCGGPEGRRARDG